MAEINKYYGFNFFGAGSDRELAQTHLPVGQLGLDDILYSAKTYASNIKFKVLFGTIKELTLFNDVVRGNAPCKAGKEKYQAFILQRENDLVTGEGDEYFINGEKLELGFSQYDVNVIKIF